MSYRNPQQVVDTQSGQAFADLQKTISGTFAGVADTYKKDQAAEAARQNKIAEKSNEDASFQAQKTNEGIAQLKQPTIEKTAVTNEEITMLLEAAKKTIAMQKTMDVCGHSPKKGFLLQPGHNLSKITVTL